MPNHVVMSLALVATLATPVVAVAKTPKAAAPTCAPVTAEAVEAQFKLFNDAWATKNPDTVTSLFAKDGVLLATVSNTPRTTPDAVKDYFVSFLKGAPVGTINTSTVKLAAIPPRAWERGQLR